MKTRCAILSLLFVWGSVREECYGQASASAYSLSFDGVNDYVALGNPSQLGLAAFTVECWFKKTGAGSTTSTGTGGVTAVPLVAKGRGETDASNKDMNYFLGIRTLDNKIVADFEEGANGTSPGLNHPIAGKTAIQNNVWYHVCASYDGFAWKLYLNGLLDNELYVGQPVRSDSIQHASIGSALTSTGAPQGYFKGNIDEVRIWTGAQPPCLVCDNCAFEINSSPLLIAAFCLEEGSGNVISSNAEATLTGTVNGASWSSNAPLLMAAGQIGAPLADTDCALHTGTVAGTTQRVFVEVPDSAAVDITTAELTVETCFLFSDITQSVATTLNNSVPIIPLVCKGHSEAVELNYALGLKNDAGTARLIAAFEVQIGAISNLKFSLTSTGSVPANVWHHAAMTYNSANGAWKLFLDGVEQTATIAGQSGTAYPTSAPFPVLRQNALPLGLSRSTTTSVEAGIFDGRISNTKIWTVVKTSFPTPNVIAPDLRNWWPISEGQGTNIANAVVAGGTSPGTLKGSPATPAINPANFWDECLPTSLTTSETCINPGQFVLHATVDGNPGDAVSAKFTITRVNDQAPFTVAFIPDTQTYVADLTNTDRVDRFRQEISFINANADAGITFDLPGEPGGVLQSGPIAFVSHCGDIVEHPTNDTDPAPDGDVHAGAGFAEEWDDAVNFMSELHITRETDGAFGPGTVIRIPYGVCPGNHDIGLSLNTGYNPLSDGYDNFKEHFGPQVYGPANCTWPANSSYEASSDDTGRSSSQHFSVNGLDFLVLHLDWNLPDRTDNSVPPVPIPGDAVPFAIAELAKPENLHRRVIITTHSFILATASRTSQAANAWTRFIEKDPRIVVVANGHTVGAARRFDTRTVDPALSASTGMGGQPVLQILQDYQDRADGGGGFVKFLSFRPAEKRIVAFTLSGLDTPVDLPSPAPAERFQETYSFDSTFAEFTVTGTVDVNGDAVLNSPQFTLPADATFRWSCELTYRTVNKIQSADRVIQHQSASPGFVLLADSAGAFPGVYASTIGTSGLTTIVGGVSTNQKSAIWSLPCFPWGLGTNVIDAAEDDIQGGVSGIDQGVAILRGQFDEPNPYQPTSSYKTVNSIGRFGLNGGDLLNVPNQGGFAANAVATRTLAGGTRKAVGWTVVTGYGWCATEWLLPSGLSGSVDGAYMGSPWLDGTTYALCIASTGISGGYRRLAWPNQELWPFFWNRSTAGQWQALAEDDWLYPGEYLPGYPAQGGYLFDVNESESFVGISYAYGYEYAMRWTDGDTVPESLAVPSAFNTGYFSRAALGINNQGIAVGYTWHNPTEGYMGGGSLQYYPYHLDENPMGLDPGAPRSSPREQALVWKADGTVYTLKEILGLTNDTFVFLRAYDISDDNVIVGLLDHNGEIKSFAAQLPADF